jgi:hypothetical protein
MSGDARDNCGACAHFRNDPAYLEATFNGLTSLSSGYASVTADDGLCLHHDRYTGPRSWCGWFRERLRGLNSGGPKM